MIDTLATLTPSEFVEDANASAKTARVFLGTACGLQSNRRRYAPLIKQIQTRGTKRLWVVRPLTMRVSFEDLTPKLTGRSGARRLAGLQTTSRLAQRAR
ncbi:hypothetical protein [Burkholderia anthina]|uniref:hypothetical protein n=1 Tax=Burkholderia anthina TaxID=179879 RepID=UPI0037BFD357